MKHIFYSVLFLTALLSCSNMTSAPLTPEAGNVAAADKQQDKAIFTEVPGLKKLSDYSTTNNIKKLDLDYKTIALKIRYIAERAYIAIGNRNTNLDWQPLRINFYYDMSFTDAEKDIHLLLKDNDPSKGYLLFPAFTEEYASYFAYYFEQNTLRYIGNYEAADFSKGPLAFDERAETFYRTADKASKLKKADEIDRADFDPVAEDIKLLKARSASQGNTVPASINKEWQGSYEGSFLRMKEESADPRAWGTVHLDIGKESVKFHLDSYEENIAKELKVISADAQKIRLAARENDKQVLTLLLDKKKYKLSGTLMEEIVGRRETYELEKK